MILKIKKIIFAAIMLLTAACLSGCASLLYGDGLLALPGLPSEYVELQSEINKVFASGALSAAAESGANRQSIQLVDIDGDGTDETIAFFRTSDGNYLIKAYRKENEKYTEIGSAESVGLSLHSIYYPNISATGQKCLAICWGIDESNNYGMEVYTFNQNGMESVLSVQYSGILVDDFYGDSSDELCFAVKDQAGGQLSLKVYAVKGKTYSLDSEVKLSGEAKSISRMALGMRAEGEQALFLDSAAIGGGYVTDVVCYDAYEGKLENITLSGEGASIESTWRLAEVFSDDIDGDGITEVPVAASIAGTIYTDERNKLNWLEWGGEPKVKLKTYHSPSDMWYLKWMDNWDDTVVVQTTRYSRMVKTVFFRLPDDLADSAAPAPDENSILLTIYIFSGDNKQAYISIYKAKELVRRDGLIYAFSLGEGPSSKYRIDEQDVIDRFIRIENEWTAEAY